MLEQMTRKEIVAVQVGPELDMLVAQHVMKWQPQELDFSEHMVWVEEVEPFTEPQWTGFISGRIYGFSAMLNSSYVDDDGIRKIISMQYSGEVWEPSTKIKMAWDVVLKLREEGLHFSLVDTPAWFAKFANESGVTVGGSRVDGISAEEAICHAALVTRMRQVQNGVGVT